MDARFWRGFALLVVFGRFVSASGISGEAAQCYRVSATDAILPPPGDSCLADGSAADGFGAVGVIEGDEVALQRALNLVYKNREEYVAVLFHASWCPFSKICRPNFNSMAAMFPTIRHFAFEESVIRPSILSRYGVHGFPTLFLLNSTMRVRYHGSRTINSLVSFYSDVTGPGTIAPYTVVVFASFRGVTMAVSGLVKPTCSQPNPSEDGWLGSKTGIQPASVDPASVGKITNSLHIPGFKEIIEQENCPFSWARSPEKLLQQDTYLALASFFVLLRMLYFFFPKLNACIKKAWRRCMQYASLLGVWDHFQDYLQEAKQGLNRLNPCKRSNLQEGAMNAKAWASKSLASVSIGERSTSRAQSTD